MSRRCPYPGCEDYHAEQAIACAEHTRLLSVPVRRLAGWAAINRRPIGDSLRIAAAMELRAAACNRERDEAMAAARAEQEQGGGRMEP